MRYETVRSAIIVLVLCGFLLLPAAARASASCPTWQAERDVKAAKKALHRAEKRLQEAKWVLSATKRYTGQYGACTGRWTRLARRVGFPRTQLPTLMYVVHRESGGDPNAKNPSSTSSGLRQFLSGWWAGKWNPFDPRQNLSHGWKAVKAGGWSPWSL
jgi:hypothetical protein